MILVDPRIGKKNGQTSGERLTHIVSTLKSRLNCPVRGAKPRLDAGDFAFEGSGPDGNITIGVEWKTVGDACTSMRSDRLAADQIKGMSDLYGMSFVIVQGIWRHGRGGVIEVRYGKTWKPLNLATKSFQYSELFKFMVSLSVKKNVVVIRTTTEDETLWALSYLYQWWQTPWDKHRSTDPIKTQTELCFTRVSLLRKMAAELPGIGWTRSIAVERAFLTVHHMVNADVAQWESIDGIGSKTAQKVYQLLRERT